MPGSRARATSHRGASGGYVRALGGLVGLVLIAGWLALNVSQVSGATPALTRSPYLTDLTATGVEVSLATNTSTPPPVVTWGTPGGGSPCSGSSANAPAAVPITVQTVTEYRFTATLSGLNSDTQYCYRVSQAGVDLLGGAPSPSFRTALPTGAPGAFTFAVVGDWGGGTADEANVLAQMAAAAPRLVVSVGDNAYPDGTEDDYGDLSSGNVFPSSYWPVLGSTVPAYLAQGHHGFAHPSQYLGNWPQDRAAAACANAGCRYRAEAYPSIDGSQPATYASAWYAFDFGNARFYILEAAWDESNVGNAGAYGLDYDAHWNPTTNAAEYQWLRSDLAAHTSTALKFAFFHDPLHSDGGAGSDQRLIGTSTSTLEGLLAANNVSIVFNGHAHIYERNLPQVPGSPMVSYVTGAGGAGLSMLQACSAFDAYALGNAGTSCHAPSQTKPHVFHFLRVDVNGTRVTVTPTDETGLTFDVQTYTFPQTATVFDFAEGYTGPGFHEYLTVENPDPSRTAALSFTYFETSGAVHFAAPTCAFVAPQRRCTESVNADVGANQQVSAEVRSLPTGGSAVPIIVERPMYFNHNFGFGLVNGGHDAVGATAGSTQRFFAEGYTGPGFQEYLTIENPNSVAMSLQFTYLIGSSSLTMQNPACKTVAPQSRCTENVNLDIGAGHEVSTLIAATNGLPFFAERPMYFKHDFGFGAIDGGHDGTGTTHTTTAADVAEGYTGPGFQEYLTMENPNNNAITMSFAYAGKSGSLTRHTGACAVVVAYSRCTVNVNTDVGSNQEVSVHLSSSGGGFIAERPMYFSHDFGFGTVNGGHDGLGVDAGTNTVQDFAEGYTAAGFREYLTIENPNSTVLQLDIQYYGAAGRINRRTPTVCASVAPHSRCTVNVDTDINASPSSGQAVSAHLDSLNGVTFLAERPMYFAHVFGTDSVNGGHVSAGYSSTLS